MRLLAAPATPSLRALDSVTPTSETRGHWLQRACWPPAAFSLRQSPFKEQPSHLLPVHAQTVGGKHSTPAAQGRALLQGSPSRPAAESAAGPRAHTAGQCPPAPESSQSAAHAIVAAFSHKVRLLTTLTDGDSAACASSTAQTLTQECSAETSSRVPRRVRRPGEADCCRRPTGGTTTETP